MTVLRHILISVENALFIVWLNDASQAKSLLIFLWYIQLYYRNNWLRSSRLQTNKEWHTFLSLIEITQTHTQTQTHTHRNTDTHTHARTHAHIHTFEKEEAGKISKLWNHHTEACSDFLWILHLPKNLWLIFCLDWFRAKNCSDIHRPVSQKGLGLSQD